MTHQVTVVLMFLYTNILLLLVLPEQTVITKIACAILELFVPLRY